MFVTALNWKLPKGPSTGKQMNTILVYLYLCAAMKRKNVSLHRVIRKALTNIMLTDRTQEKRAQAICFYLYKVERQAKGISAITGQAVGYPKGEKLCLE